MSNWNEYRAKNLDRVRLITNEAPMKDVQESKITITRAQLKNILHLFDPDLCESEPMHTLTFIQSMFEYYSHQDDIDSFIRGFGK